MQNRINEIEVAVATGAMDTSQCFTQMRQLLPPNNPYLSEYPIKLVCDALITIVTHSGNPEALAEALKPWHTKAEALIMPGKQQAITPAEVLPPLPKPSNLRRQARRDGGYDMVPAYTAEEMKVYAQAYLAAQPAQKRICWDSERIAFEKMCHEKWGYDTNKDEAGDYEDWNAYVAWRAWEERTLTATSQPKGEAE